MITKTINKTKKIIFLRFTIIFLFTNNSEKIVRTNAIKTPTRAVELPHIKESKIISNLIGNELK